MTKVSAVKIQR